MKWVFSWPKEFSSQIRKSEGCIKAVSQTVLYYLGRQSFSIITKHEMNLKRPIFCQIIKSLSFMTQSQWKLPSLCSCPVVEKKKEQTWRNKEMIMELEPVCGSGGTSVHVRHWCLARYGHSAIPEPDWVQIKSCLPLEWKQKNENTWTTFGGNICKIISREHLGSMSHLRWVHLVGYIVSQWQKDSVVLSVGSLKSDVNWCPKKWLFEKKREVTQMIKCALVQAWCRSRT